MNTKSCAALLLLLLATSTAHADSLLGKLLGPDGPAPAPAAAGTIVVGFSPARGGTSAESVVLQAVNDSRQTLRIAIFTFTSKRIAEAVLAAQKRGVRVGIIVDSDQNNGKYSAGQFLANQRVPVRVASHYGHMHQKYAVIDDKGVVTGSFNWTLAAAKDNAENVVYLPNSPATAAQFRDEWIRLWEESEDLPPKY